MRDAFFNKVVDAVEKDKNKKSIVTPAVLKVFRDKGEELGGLPDRPIYRIIVYFLGAVTIIAAIGAAWLAGAGKTIPEVLVALGSAAIGALAGVITTAAKEGQ